MGNHRSVYMVFSPRADCYLRVYKGELCKRLPNLTLESADGDESNNVVTYWYKQKEEW